jgi:hypothetical protein
MRLFCILGILAVLLLPGLSHAKPAPPQRLTLMLNELSELEAKYESGEWDKALESCERVTGEFRKLLPELRNISLMQITSRFTAVLDGLKASLKARNRERTEIAHRALHKLFFQIMGEYDYPSPPVLEIVSRNLDEAKEALDKGEINEVAIEINEVGEFLELSKAVLQSRGVPETDLAAAQQLIGGIKVSAQGNQTQEVKKGLSSLVAKVKGYRQLFQKN